MGVLCELGYYDGAHLYVEPESRIRASEWNERLYHQKYGNAPMGKEHMCEIICNWLIASMFTFGWIIALFLIV
jgi:hypothetical protein